MPARDDLSFPPRYGMLSSWRKQGEGEAMELAIDTSLPVLPVETPAFSVDPDPFLAAARTEHPWLARFSQGYGGHGYQACADLLADDKNMMCGFGPIIDYYGVRGTMWARFMEEIVISQSGASPARLRGAG